MGARGTAVCRGHRGNSLTRTDSPDGCAPRGWRGGDGGRQMGDCGGDSPPGVAGPKAESGAASLRTGNPGLPSQAVRNVHLSRWEDRASFIYQFVSVMDNPGTWRHMLCAAQAAGTPPTAAGPHHSGAFSLTSNC